MAELKVEPKRGMGWLWVVIVLVVLAIVAWLFFAGTDAELSTTSIGALAGARGVPPMLI